jgi:nucleotide-binding universal stress UspA family protein
MISALKKIIVCLDHTDIDKTVLENACEVSKVAGTTELIFLNVIKDFHLPSSMKKEFPELLNRAIEERKNDIKNHVAKHFNCEISYKILIRQGNETKEILKTANESKADLIILGRKKISDSVLSTRVARRSPCNLLIIPENTKISFDAVFVPVDFSDYSLLSLKRTLLLTDNMKSKIYLQNVYTVPSSYRYSGKTFKEFGAIMKEHSSKDLGALIKQIKPTSQELIPVYTLDKTGHTVKLLLGEAKKKKANLIVMGAKGRTTASALFIGSKAERMMRINDEIPLLVIRKKGAVAGLLETLMDLSD